MATTVVGKERLKAKFKAMPVVVQREIKRGVSDSADSLMGMMRRLVPVDKGVLAASIRADKEEGFRASVMAGGTAATRREVRKGSGIWTDEAILTEFGTKPHRLGGLFKGALHPGTASQPFFFPAWRASKKSIKSKIGRAISKGVKQVAKSGR